MDSTNPTTSESFPEMQPTSGSSSVSQAPGEYPREDIPNLLRAHKKLPSSSPPSQAQASKAQQPHKEIITHCYLCNTAFENFPAHIDFCRVQMLECFCAPVHNKCWKEHCHEYTEFNQRPIPDVVCVQCGEVVKSCMVLNGRWFDREGKLVEGNKEDRVMLRRSRAVGNFKEEMGSGGG